MISSGGGKKHVIILMSASHYDVTFILKTLSIIHFLFLIYQGKVSKVNKEPCTLAKNEDRILSMDSIRK